MVTDGQTYGRTDIQTHLKNGNENNKAGYTAQGSPSTRLKITLDGRTYGPTDLRTDGQTDTPSYRDATAHLKSGNKQELR